jgi:diguanylate cyclase (GGDEF)-like protein
MITTDILTYTARHDWQHLLDVCADTPKNQILIQVFCGFNSSSIIEKLLDELRDDFPGVCIVGATTAGEIHNSKAFEHSIQIAFSRFEYSTVRSGLVSHSENQHASAQFLSQAINQTDTKAVILYARGVMSHEHINSAPLLDALHTEMGDIIITGANAGDNGKLERTFVFTEKGLSSDGIAAVSIAGKHLYAHNHSILGWEPVGRDFVITKAENNRVHTIDDLPVRDVISHFLGPEVADELPRSVVGYPFIVDDDGLYRASHIIDEDDEGGFSVSSPLYAGDSVRFGFCHAGMLAQSAKSLHNEMHRVAPQSIFVFSCISRKRALGKTIGVELSAFDNIAPTCGFFGYGEYYTPTNGWPLLLTLTQTVLTLAEHPDGEPSHGPDRDYRPVIEESELFKSLRVLQRLMDITTREIEGINVELTKLVSRDALTGLGNRRRFEERIATELKNQGRSHLPMSVLMVEVDFFREYNASFGAALGDDCLRTIAQILSRVAKRPTDMCARYGGATFGCILPMTDNNGAMKLAQDIQNQIETKAILHDRSNIGDYVTVSVAVLHIKSDRSLTVNTIISGCHSLLEDAKAQGGNRVVADEVQNLNAP